MTIRLPDDVMDREQKVKKLLRHHVPSVHQVDIVTPPCRVITAEGRVVAVSFRFDLPESIRWIVPALDASPASRIGGGRITFGGSGSGGNHGRGFPWRSQLDRDDPALVRELAKLAGALDRQLARRTPEQHRMHHAFTDPIPDRYKLGTSAWTSGVLNFIAMPFHPDSRQNLAGSVNAMVFLRQQADGGHLVVPAWDLAFECADGQALIHDGSFLHGVTPIVTNDEDGYRISIAYYALAKLGRSAM